MKSKLLIALFAFVSVFVVFNMSEPDHNQFTGDRCGYYLYLPAIFIYHDLKHLTFYPKVDSEYAHGMNLEYSLYDINGNKLDKYAIGVAILESPLFFVANAYCKTTNTYPADGFSKPYQLAGLFSGILFVIAGLFILRRFLQKYFSDPVTAATLLCIAFGTNLYNYTVFEGEMSHSYSFFLFSCLISLTDTCYSKPPQKRISILFGLVLGLIFIVRPINIIACIIPLLWKANDLASFKERVNYLSRNLLQVFIAFLFALLIAFIQFSYWEYITGHWLYYSYQGEGFDFLHPNIINGLFSYRKGWFLYTPMALVGIFGIYYLYKRDKKTVPALILFFLLMVYSIFSWHEWWYGSGFSCRPLVESIAILSLPLAAINEHYYNAAFKIKKTLYLTLISFFIILNIFQSYQYSMGLLNGSRMSKEQYWYIFGKASPVHGDYEKYLRKDE